MHVYSNGNKGLKRWTKSNPVLQLFFWSYYNWLASLICKNKTSLDDKYLAGNNFLQNENFCANVFLTQAGKDNITSFATMIVYHLPKISQHKVTQCWSQCLSYFKILQKRAIKLFSWTFGYHLQAQRINLKALGFCVDIHLQFKSQKK